MVDSRGIVFFHLRPISFNFMPKSSQIIDWHTSWKLGPPGFCVLLWEILDLPLLHTAHYHKHRVIPVFLLESS